MKSIWDDLSGVVVLVGTLKVYYIDTRSKVWS